MCKLFYFYVLFSCLVSIFLWSLFCVKPTRTKMIEQLANLDRVISLDKLLKTRRDVIEYYTRTTLRDYKWLYLMTGHRGMHSRTKGMSLVDRVGHYVDVDYRVHELGFGKGANLLDLSRQFPSIRMSGVDFTPAHVAITQGRLQKAGIRATTVCGDWKTHAPSELQDVVFAVESLSHVESEQDVAAVCEKVGAYLKPNGVFIIIDGFLGPKVKDVNELDRESKRAILCFEFGFRLTRLFRADIWKQAAVDNGLVLHEDVSLVNKVMPFWTLGWRIARFVLMMPAVVRRYVRGRPKDRSETFANLMAVSLFAPLLHCDLAEYRMMVFRKPLH